MAFRSACFILIGLQLINSSQAQYAYKITTWSKNGAGEFKERASFFEIYNADSLLVEKRNSRNCDKSCEGTRYEYNEKRQKILKQISISIPLTKIRSGGIMNMTGAVC